MIMNDFNIGRGYCPPEIIKASIPKDDPASHRLTLPEAQDRATLLALFDKLDARGQRTTLVMLAVAVKLHPRDKS